jgi:DNA (cytosine-5)-methyltransferase 1
MRVLNLYAGIGGNRKLWDNCEVTAVENNPEIAKIYSDLFPDDAVIVTDAHEFLLLMYNEFDFIWSSPPCPTHSDIRRCGVHAGRYEALYPDMKLYEEIILLQNFANKKTKWVVENVKPYYEPLIPAVTLHRHLFWTNFQLEPFSHQNYRKIASIDRGVKEVYGFNIEKYKNIDDRKVLRNLVNPKLGLHIFNCALSQFEEKTEQGKLF